MEEFVNQKISQNNQNLNLVNILGIMSTSIDTALIMNNTNTQFLSYLNSYYSDTEVVIFQQEQIELRNVNITGNINTENYISAIYMKSFSIKIENSSFTKNFCPLCYRGSVMYIYGSSYFLLSNSNMSENVGMMGGVLFLQQTTDSLIENCIFQYNIAQSLGGALYLQYIQKIIFTETLIINNSADIGGGIYYNSFYSKKFEDVTVVNNTAGVYGQNIGSFPQKINIMSYQSSQTHFNKEGTDDNLKTRNLNDEQSSENKRLIQSEYERAKQQGYNQGYFNQSIEITNFRSGDFLNLQIELLDEEGNKIYLQKDKKYYHEQTIKLIETFIIFVTPEDENGVKVSGKNQIQIEDSNQTDGLWYFNELKIIGHPNLQNKFFRIVMGQIKQYDMYNFLQSKNFLITDFPSYEIRVSINFRPCLIGEIYNCDEDNQYCTCTPCSPGSYSLQIYNNSSSRQICELCPDSAQLCQKDQIFLKQGYWRISKDTDKIVSCYNKRENCKGNSIDEILTGDQTCKEGHIGPLCESCDTYGIFWRKPYMRLSNYKCIECSELNNFASVLPFIMIFVIMAVYIIFSIRVSIHLSKRQIYSYYFRKFGFLDIGVSNAKNQTQFYVKQFMHYIQIAVIVNNYDFNIPYLTEYLPYLISSPLKNTIYSFDCVFAYFDEVPIVYFRSIWSLIVPFFYLVTLAIIYLSIYIMKKTKRYNKFYIYNGLLFMLVLFQPGIVSSLFQVVSCREIAGKYYISADVTYECYTKQYYQYILLLIVPGILLWGAIIPCFIFKKIFNNRNRLDQYEVKLKFGFLFVDYKKQFYFWEFIKIYEKVIILIISIMCEGLFSTKLILICAVIISYLIFCIKKQPYMIKAFNDFDVRVTLVLLALILINLFLYNNEDSFIYDFFAFVCALLHNVILFVLILQILITKMKNRYIDFFNKLFFRIKKLIPSFFSFIHIQPPTNTIRLYSNWRKVQIAKDVIVQNIQKGNHITSIEQLKKSYQDYVQQLQISLISAIQSKKMSRTHQELGQSASSIIRHKRLIDLSSNISPLSVKGQKKLVSNKNKKRFPHSKSQFKSAQNLENRSQNRPIIDLQSKHFNLSKMNFSDTQYGNPMNSIEHNQMFNLSNQHSNLASSAQKIEDNITSQTYLQKNGSPKSNQMFTLASNYGKESTAHNNNQLFLLQNSINANQLQRSIYQNSAYNLQDETNLLFFNSGFQLVPPQTNGQEFNFSSKSVKRWSPSKQSSPKNKKDTQKKQQFISISSSSGEESLTESSISSYSKSEQTMQEDSIKDQCFRNQRSKSLGQNITHKYSDGEIQSQNDNQRSVSSPQFESEISIEGFTNQRIIIKNSEEIPIENLNFRQSLKLDDTKNNSEKVLNQNSQRIQLRQDSLFSFQQPDLMPSTAKYKVQNSLVLNKLNSQEKSQSQNQIKFNFEKQNLDLGDSIETLKHFQSISELQKNTFSNQIINEQRNESLIKLNKNEPYLTQQIKTSINQLTKQSSKNQMLDLQMKSSIRLDEPIQLSQAIKTDEYDKEKQDQIEKNLHFNKI